MFNPQNWRLEDPCPGQIFDTINPIFLRILSALIRSKNKTIVKEGFLNLVGAIDMMDGLDYHYEHLCTIVNQIAKLPFLDVRMHQKKLQLIHETVAYINRLGQFYHFASSNFVTSKLYNWKQIIPTIIQYKRFRDKHSAHRSLDKPHKEDSLDLQQAHAWALSSLGGNFFLPKSGYAAPRTTEDILNRKMWTDSYCCFQMAGNSSTDAHELISIERDHPIFVNEAYSLISTLLSLP